MTGRLSRFACMVHGCAARHCDDLAGELRKSQIRKAPPDFFKDFKAASTRG
jgi:hypothetical protein